MSLIEYCNTERQKEIVRLFESGMNKTEIGRDARRLPERRSKGTLKDTFQ